ncbi:somatostatin receptor type 5-like [Oculina patagonica]
MENCTVTHCENATSTTGNVSDTQANGSVTNLKSSPADELKLSLQVLIALFGLVGNVLVFIAIRELKNKKSTTDVYIQNLAIADLGVLMLLFPLVAIRERAPFGWPLGKFVCLFLYPIPDTFQGASVWCIAAVAIERYRKMLTPRRHNQTRRKTILKRTKIVSACVWVVSFLIFSLPLYFIVEYREFPNCGKWCGPVWPSWDRNWVLARSYTGLLTIFSYIMPLAIISWTYLAISRTIHRSNVFIKSLKGGDGKANDKDRFSLTSKNVRLRQNKRAKKILTPIVVIFAVTMLPLSILRITVVVWTEIAAQNFYENLLYAVMVFVMLNSSANPVIYFIASKNFRRRIKNLLRSR